MAEKVQVTRSSELDNATGGQTEGMARKGAIIGKSQQLCALVMVAQPHSSSAVHHHGEQDTIVYAAKGYGSIVFDGGRERKDLSPGDFAIIPAYTEHQEVNESDGVVEWVITRGGSTPATVNLDHWGQS